MIMVRVGFGVGAGVDRGVRGYGLAPNRVLHTHTRIHTKTHTRLHTHTHTHTHAQHTTDDVFDDNFVSGKFPINICELFTDDATYCTSVSETRQNSQKLASSSSTLHSTP